MIAIEEIRKMSLSEKVQLLETVWAEISLKPEQVSMPQWHQDLLDEREHLINEGKASFIDWEEAKSQIRDATR
jgi:putative addiction module component (TIGR02574 family)